MAELATAEFWARWLAIVILDLTLAGDNALVIALAVRNLPKRQQLQGRLWGTFGAVGLRLMFIGVITFLLRIPLRRATPRLHPSQSELSAQSGPPRTEAPAGPS